MDTHIISQQWATRPADERFLSLDALHAHNVAKRKASAEAGVAVDHLEVLPAADGGEILIGAKGTGKAAPMTNWAFGQLAARASAPAAYLRTLPSELAVLPLQWSIDHTREDAKILTRKEPDGWRVHAMTSDTYGRIYDAEMTEALCKYIDPLTWKIPGASYASTDPLKATTLYASDRDCFVALVDEQHPVEVPGGNGQDTMFRGFIVRNSEVGAAAYDLMLFLYRRICDNRIIHGLGANQTVKIRHTAGGPMRFMKEAAPALQAYVQSSSEQAVQAIQAAQHKVIGDNAEAVHVWLRNKKFSVSEAKRTIENAQREPGNPFTLWNVVQGATAMGHDAAFGDERFDLERRAGKLLDAVV
jgi:hypothetical protein